MAKPQVFISSTYYDLKHIRASIEGFVENLGYEAILSEKGKIAYDPDIALDESCYRTAAEADIFVLIIGGRYGSETSDEEIKDTSKFYERYESVTKKEYESAAAKDKPVYILVDKAVFNEYETFKKNRDNASIEYAHVDSVNIFKLLDQIMSKRKNNPLQLFEKHADIESWLREQWAGLFRELINRRSENKQLMSLSERVDDLSEINSSLQRYLEQVVSKVSSSPEEATKIITEENKRQAEHKQRKEIEKLPLISELMDLTNISIDETIKLYTSSTTVNELASKLNDELGKEPGELLDFWKNNEPEQRLNDINEIRSHLLLGPLDFE
jgi:hypothetical protein